MADTDIDREAAHLADAEATLNTAWLWHVPRGRVEAAVVGAVASWLIPALTATVYLEGWPWWQRVLVATVVAPWLLIAVAMATRAPWCLGVTRTEAVVAATPALAWAMAVIAAHAATSGGWLSRLTVPLVYIALSAGTVTTWRKWTEATASRRRTARWSAEGEGL